MPGVGANLQDHLLAGGNVYRARQPVPPSKYQHSESLLYIERDVARGAPELVVACVIAPIVTELFAAPEVGTAYTLIRSRVRFIRVCWAPSVSGPWPSPSG